MYSVRDLIMLVATKLPILLQLIAELLQPTQLTDTLTTPILAQYSIKQVTISTPAAEYEIGMYCSSAACRQLVAPFT